MHHHTTAGLGPRSPANALIIPVMRRDPFTGVDPIHPCESVHRTGRGKACLAPTPLPGHVTVVTPWHTSLPRKSPPLPGHTTVIGPCPDGPGDHREMFRHRDRMRSSGPVRYTRSCHRRHAVAHIVAAQIPTVTRSHNRHRPPSGSPPDH